MVGRRGGALTSIPRRPASVGSEFPMMLRHSSHSFTSARQRAARYLHLMSASTSSLSFRRASALRYCLPT